MIEAMKKLNTSGKIAVVLLAGLLLLASFAILIVMISNILATLIFLGGVIVGSMISRRNLYRDHQKDPLYKTGVSIGELNMLNKLKDAEIKLFNKDKKPHDFKTAVEAREYINQQVAKKTSSPEATMTA